MSSGRYRELDLDDYVAASALELGGHVASGDLSPVHLAECALELAQCWEPTVNAYVELMSDTARAEAARLEAEARQGRLRSAVHGVPIASKDNFLIEGFPIRKGSRTTPDVPATASSPMVARLRAAGANVIGRTTMPEHGWKGTGNSPLTGVTRNPWDPACNSGGSSSGSSATVATGAVPIATGSDAGGSIRIPASFCGIVGFKPTLGAIPVWPPTANENLSHAGPLTRSVDDARLVFDITRGADPCDPQSAFPVRRAGLGDRPVRVGIVRAPFGIAPSDEVAAAFDRAIELLRAAPAMTLLEAALDREVPDDVFETLWVVGRGLSVRPLISEHGAVMDPGLARLAPLAEACSAADYVAALARRREFNEWAFALFETWDYLVMPTMPIVAFAADAEVPPGGNTSSPLPWIGWTPYTYPFNISGQPCISIPLPTDNPRLPVGLQLVAPWGADDALLDLAHRVELQLAPAAGRPPVPACSRDHRGVSHRPV